MCSFDSSARNSKWTGKSILIYRLFQSLYHNDTNQYSVTFENKHLQRIIGLHNISCLRSKLKTRIYIDISLFGKEYSTNMCLCMSYISFSLVLLAQTNRKSGIWKRSSFHAFFVLVFSFNSFDCGRRIYFFLYVVQLA